MNSRRRYIFNPRNMYGMKLGLGISVFVLLAFAAVSSYGTVYMRHGKFWIMYEDAPMSPIATNFLPYPVTGGWYFPAEKQESNLVWIKHSELAPESPFADPSLSYEYVLVSTNDTGKLGVLYLNQAKVIVANKEIDHIGAELAATNAVAVEAKKPIPPGPTTNNSTLSPSKVSGSTNATPLPPSPSPRYRP